MAWINLLNMVETYVRNSSLSSCVVPRGGGVYGWAPRFRFASKVVVVFFQHLASLVKCINLTVKRHRVTIELGNSCIVLV